MILKNGWEFINDRTKSGRGRYSLNRGDGQTIPLTGCTTILNEQAKPFLIGWAASEAYKDCLANGYSKEQLEEIIKLKKYAHTKKGDEAKATGTDAHDLVENFIRHYIKTKEYLPLFGDNKEANVSAKRFFDWAVERKVEFISCEVSVFDDRMMVGGSFDFICKIDGEYYLGDFKTSKQIDNTYYAQTAFYINATNRMKELNGEEKINFKGAVIVKSVKQEGDIEYMEKYGTGWRKVVIPAFEVKFAQDIDRHMIYFKSLYNAYKYNKDQKVEFIEEYASKYPELSDEELLKLETA